MKQHISFLGLGYVGLTTAVCQASKGFKVLGFDTDSEKIKLIKEGSVPFHEPKLGKMLVKVTEKGSFICTSDYKESILNTDISFITVGTPSLSEGSINLAYIQNVSEMIGEALKEKVGWHLIVVKSTVLPSTTMNVVRPLIEKDSGKRYNVDFGLCMNPEFLREGSAVEDTLHPDRLIIGGNDTRSVNLLEKMYKGFYNHLPPVIKTTTETAELIKYVNNAFLAMKVSFINMMAYLCQKLPGIDVETIAKGIGLDRRIGPLFLRAGAGWGGSCWPKDLEALKHFAEEKGVNLPLIDSTLKVNDIQPYLMVDLAKKLIGDLSSRRISVLGLSFKPDSDDMRKAVSIKVVNGLIDEGARVVVYDPMALENARQIFRDKVEYAPSVSRCLEGSECALIITEWDKFKHLTPDDFIRRMKIPAVVDGRRIYNPSLFSSRLRFQAIGLGISNYVNPALAVNAIILDHDRLLLIKRMVEPFRGMWSLPGGFVEYNELVGNALTREVKEETGLMVNPIRLIDVSSNPLRSPVKHVVTITYLAEVLGGSIIGSGESIKVKFFPMKKLPSKLAFDHKEIIHKYLTKID